MERLARQKDIIPTTALDTCIGIMGVGGVGTWVAVGAAMMGIKKIILMDDDNVDLNNLNRQFFKESDVGRPKVDAMRDILLSINSKIEVLPYNDRIESLEQIPEEIDVMMSGIDNYEGRFLLEEWVNINKKKLVIDMGTTTNATGGSVLQLMYGKTPTYKVMLGEEGVKVAEEEMATPACSRNPEPAIVTTTARVAFLGLDLLRQFLTTRHKDGDGKVYKGMFIESLGRRPMTDFQEQNIKGWSG